MDPVRHGLAPASNDNQIIVPANNEPRVGRSMLIVGAVVFVAAAAIMAISGAASAAGLTVSAILIQSLLIATTATLAVWSQHRLEGRRRRRVSTTPPPNLDSVTGVLNEGSITVKLLELLAVGDRYGNKLSIAIAGVDHLKDVNERFGRAVGDKALRAIAGALAETLRTPDRLGRIADDRFLIILPETDIVGAEQIGERLRQAISEVEIDADERIRIGLTASIGVTAFRRGDDLENLVSRANRVMKQAKLLGRNRVLTDLAA